MKDRIRKLSTNVESFLMGEDGLEFASLYWRSAVFCWDDARLYEFHAQLLGGDARHF